MTKPSLLYNGKSSTKTMDNNNNRYSPSGGCMSAIFHIFHRHLPFHQPSNFISETSINNIPKGLEAPRNSLDLANFNIPHMQNGIQIKTKRSRLTEEASSESCNTSPSTKTPNLVARLMGLDLLPEASSSPRSSLTSPRPLLNPLSKLSSYKNNARSLPATPRVSTAARPSTEIDHHHRRSLQNIDESTRQYAKRIAKQVRENINRRSVGADITNTHVKKREERRDEFLLVLKPKRPPPTPFTATATGESTNLVQVHGCGKENEPVPLISCSPRLRFLKTENNINKPKPKPKPNSNSNSPCSKVQKCKRIIASEKYDSRLKKFQRREETFIKKSNMKKSTPLSKHLVNVHTSTKLLQKQVQLSSITRLPSSNNNVAASATTESDMRSRLRVFGGIAFEEEVEEVVTEIERDVVDTLVGEMARIIWHVGCGSRV